MDRRRRKSARKQNENGGGGGGGRGSRARLYPRPVPCTHRFGRTTSDGFPTDITHDYIASPRISFPRRVFYIFLLLSALFVLRAAPRLPSPAVVVRVRRHVPRSITRPPDVRDRTRSSGLALPGRTNAFAKSTRVIF